MKTNAFVGIDFGTSTCCAAWYDPQTGRAEVIPNGEGESKTPSVLYFDEGRTIVGAVAEQMIDSMETRKRVFRNIKRQLASDAVRQIGDRSLTMVEMAAAMLEKVRVDAEQGHFHGQGIDKLTHAVITYPASFDTTELEALRDAAHAAGFEAVEFLHEPVAAAIAYSRQGLAVGQFVFVYDLGGGTFDLALLARDDLGAFRLGAEPVSDKRGGEDFDRLIYTHFDQMIRQKTQAPLSKDGLDPQFLRECRKVKEMLSKLERWDFTWNSAANGPIALSIRRDEFEKLIEKEIDKTVKQTRSVFREAESNNQKVESVILIGGSSRIPLIERKLREALPIPPLKWNKQDVAVALGAAYHAAAIWGGAQATTSTSRVEDPKTVTIERSRNVSWMMQAAAIEQAKPAPQAIPPQPEPPKEFQPGDEAQALLNLASDSRTKASEVQDSDAAVREAQRQQLLTQGLGYAQAACDLEPQWPDAFYFKALIQMDQGQLSIAGATWTVMLRLPMSDELSAVAWFNRGRCKSGLNDHAGAKSDFDRAIEKDAFAMAFWNRGLSLYRTGDIAPCARDLRKYVELRNPAESSTITVLGAIELTRIGDPSAARELFQRALAEWPKTNDIEKQFEFHNELEIFSLLGEAVQLPMPNAPSVVLTDPVRTIQRLFLIACLRKDPTNPEEAVDFFLCNNSWTISPEVWTGVDANFPLYVSKWCLSPQRNEYEKGLYWLQTLLAVQPQIDARTLQSDRILLAAARRDGNLKAYLTPVVAVSEDHGSVLNGIYVTNHSAYTLHNIRIQSRWDHATHGRKTATYTLGSLAAGVKHSWSNTFPEGGFFGRFISNVIITWSCDEKQGIFS